MTPGGIAILSTCGLIAVALIGAWVELFKTRKAQQQVHHEITPNGGNSLRDAVNRIAARVETLHAKLDENTQRLVRVETRTENWATPNRRSSDG